MTTTGKTGKAGLEFAVYVRKFGSMKPRVVGGTEGRAGTGSCERASVPRCLGAFENGIERRPERHG